jgi:hypothetical protein
MPVPRQTPRRINFDQDVRYARIVENAATQHLFRLRFMPKLQHDEKRRRPVLSCQFAGGTKHLSRYRYAAFDRRVSAVRHDQLRKG